MVDIQQGTLCTFKHDAVAAFARLVQQFRNIIDHRQQPFTHRQRAIEYLLVIDRVGLEIIHQHEVMVLHHLFQPGCKMLDIDEISKSYAAPGNLVFVSRADTTTRGTDGLLATRDFPRLVEGDMVRQDQRAGLADLQT